MEIKDTDNIEDLFQDTPDFGLENPEDVIDSAPLLIDLDEVNNQAKEEAKLITERLSAYYFDQKYIDKHPYIPTKIMTEMNNIRRLLKMLSVNEKAQDSLIQNISCNAGKATLYSSLTSLQSAMLNIQTQLNTLTSNLEQIFSEMQAECDRTFEEKDKDIAEDGSITVRGSRDFIKELNARLYGQQINKTEAVDTETGEVINLNN